MLSRVQGGRVSRGRAVPALWPEQPVPPRQLISRLSAGRRQLRGEQLLGWQLGIRSRFHSPDADTVGGEGAAATGTDPGWAGRGAGRPRVCPRCVRAVSTGEGRAWILDLRVGRESGCAGDPGRGEGREYEGPVATALSLESRGAEGVDGRGGLAEWDEAAVRAGPPGASAQRSRFFWDPLPGGSRTHPRPPRPAPARR